LSKEKFHKIFEAGDCLSIEQMQAYLAGKLSAKEVYLFEKHLNACALCRDEFEGLQAMKKPEQLPKVIEKLNSEVDEFLLHNKKLAAKRKSIFLRIAAVIIILIGSVFFINYYVQYNTQSYQVSDYKELEINPLIVPELPKAVSNEKKIIKNEAKKTEKKTVKEDLQMKIKAPQPEKVPAEKKLVEKEYADVPAADVMAEYTEEVSAIAMEDEVSEGEEDIPEDSMANLTISRAKMASKKLVAEEKAALNNGIFFYEQGDYSTALKFLKEAEKLEENPEKTNYYLGLTYFSLNKNIKAGKYFDKLLQNKSSVYYEDALWQKALLLIAQNKTKDARRLLNQIIQDSLKYAEKAKFKLDSLDK